MLPQRGARPSDRLVHQTCRIQDLHCGDGVIESTQVSNVAAAVAGVTVGEAVRKKVIQLRVSIFLLLACSCCVMLPAFGQSQGAKKQNATKDDGVTATAKTIHVGVDIVLVNATVTDPYNRLVTGLDKEDFQVFEDGVPQEVAYYSSEDIPVSIGVIFDMSGSMSDKVNKARQSAVQFFKTANPQDEFFLVSFNEHAELTSRFTSSVEDLQSRLMYTAARGRTALLDGVYLGLSQMKGAHNDKKALLIISDGGDNHSRYSVNDVKNFVKEANVQIYSMGIFESGGGATQEELEGPSLLTEMCDLTGGRLFRVNSLDELPDVATKIGMELRNQYILGYKPSNKTTDGHWRKIKVKVHPPRGLPPLNVFARTGYFGPDH
jgi:Ca-activated chloride channel homolog